MKPSWENSWRRPNTLLFAHCECEKLIINSCSLMFIFVIMVQRNRARTVERVQVKSRSRLQIPIRNVANYGSLVGRAYQY